MRRAARAGAYRHSLALEAPTRATDGDGGYTSTWAALDPSPVWGAVEPATAAALERRIGAAIEAKVTHLVEIRYHDQVTTKTRVVLDSTRYLYVRGIQHVDEGREVTVLACEEVIA